MAVWPEATPPHRMPQVTPAPAPLRGAGAPPAGARAHCSRPDCPNAQTDALVTTAIRLVVSPTFPPHLFQRRGAHGHCLAHALPLLRPPPSYRSFCPVPAVALCATALHLRDSVRTRKEIMCICAVACNRPNHRLWRFQHNRAFSCECNGVRGRIVRPRPPPPPWAVPPPPGAVGAGPSLPRWVPALRSPAPPLASHRTGRGRPSPFPRHPRGASRPRKLHPPLACRITPPRIFKISLAIGPEKKIISGVSSTRQILPL